MNLSDMWQTWLKATTSPNDITYEELRQKPDATLSTALIWMVIYGAIAAVVGLITTMMFRGMANAYIEQMLAMPDLSAEARAQIQAIANSGILSGLGGLGIGSIITVPLGFLVGTGILHLIARLFGGTGQFGRYAYLNAAYQAPLGILSALLTLVPFVGSCLSPLIGIYQILLAYFAVKVEHQLTSGKAIVVVLLPIIIVMLLGMCLFASLFGMIMGLQNQ